MKRVIFAFAFCLLALTAHAQDEPPPLPLTQPQLLAAQDEVRLRVSMLSYRIDFQEETLDDAGSVTGSKAIQWRVLWLKKGARAEKVSETPSTLRRLRVLFRGFARGLPVFFSPFCHARYSGTEDKNGRTLLRYRTWSGGEYGREGCFDGLVWVNSQGTPVEADGRRVPASEMVEGLEIVYPRAHYWMREGLPVKIEGEDLLRFNSRRDKNGEPLRVRMRLKVLFSGYRRARTSEPRVIEQGDVEP